MADKLSPDVNNDNIMTLGGGDVVLDFQGIRHIRRDMLGIIKQPSRAKFNLWGGYLITIGMVALATWLKYLAQPNVIPADVPIVYILAIVLTATFYGLGPSLLCCVLSLGAYSYFFMPPIYTFTFKIDFVPISLIFFTVGVVISYLSSNLRKKTEDAKNELALLEQSEAELITYREHLEELVKQRTAELKKSNLDLKEENIEHKKDESEKERLLKISTEQLNELQSLLDNAPVAIWIARDIECRTITGNIFANRLFGVKMGDNISQSAELSDVAIAYKVFRGDKELKPEELPSQVAASTGESVSPYEMELVFDDGRKINMMIGAVPLLDAAGKARGSVAMGTDISVLKTVQEKIKVSELRYRRLFEAAKDGILILDANTGLILDVNPFLINMLGLSFEEFVGKSLWELGFLKDIITSKAKFLELQRQEYIRYEDLPLRTADGQLMNVEFVSNVYEVDHQKIIQCNIRNITERKHAEEKLKETSDYLNSLIDYANAPIIVWNPDFKITRFNHAFEKLTGLKADEVMGGGLDILFQDDSRDESMKHIHEATSGERWEVVEIPIKNKDGTVRILLWNSANIYAPDSKKVIATIAQGQDITERKKAEQLKDEFIGLVSHELRTPMTVINGSLRTAMSEGISSDDKDYLIQNAVEGANSLSSILENLLELSRYQAGRLQIHRETVEIPYIAQNVIGKLKAPDETHKFAVDFPDDLPPVEADPVRVERILYNLLENAIKYSTEKSVIKVHAQKKNGMVVTVVEDKGVGMSAEDKGKLFELFERVGDPSKARGLGLGLVVCKRLVEAQGGQIWVESKEGQGSSFYFTLPINKTTV
jgi:PAS domain S-box-containing protein